MVWAQLTLAVGADEIVLQRPQTRLTIFVDDAAASGEAADARECVGKVVAAAEQLAGVLEDEFGGNISLETAAIVASNPSVARMLRARLGAYVGAEGPHVTTLGVD